MRNCGYHIGDTFEWEVYIPTDDPENGGYEDLTVEILSFDDFKVIAGPGGCITPEDESSILRFIREGFNQYARYHGLKWRAE